MGNKTMKTLYYDQCNGIVLEQILNDVDSQPGVERVMLIGETEWEIRTVDSRFVSELRNRNIELKIVHGSARNEYYEEHYRQIGLDIANVIFWETFWIYWSYQNLLGSGIIPDNYLPSKFEFKHKFISLNNRSHFHRCVFIEEMAKQNQLNNGVVTWVKHLNENSDYPFNYFDNNQRLLQDNFVSNLDAFVFPSEYHDSLLHVVTEATSKVPFITEKTCNPILLKKPFIALGCKGFNKKLVELGFKLHDDIFDYSFDDVDDIHLRTEMFVSNLKALENKNIIELYDQMYPTIIHNYNRARTLLSDKSYIPNEMLEYNDLYSDSRLSHRVQLFLEHPKKQTKQYSIWIDNPNYLNEIDSNSVSEVIVDNTVEVEYTMLQGDTNGLAKLADKCVSQNIPLTLLTSVHHYTPLLDNTIADKINIVTDSCFWIAKHTHAMLAADNRTVNESLGYDLFDKDVGLAEDVHHLYITMNNIAKIHRCQMMDMLAKYELIEKGAITWRDAVRHTEIASEDNRSGFNYKYWTPKRMFLDIEENNTTYVNQNLIPIQYKHSFMQLVAESEDTKFFLSEKTAVPLLCNKPFLVVSCKDFHKNLVDLGFVLYDELFDYSFDSIEDDETRIEKIVANVNRLKDCSKDTLLELTEMVKPKLEHNRRVAIEHIKNTINTFTPYLVKLENSGCRSQLGLLGILEKDVHRF